MAMLMLSVEYDAKKLLKAFKKVCVPTLRHLSDH
jgi:hypothetical protein